MTDYGAEFYAGQMEGSASSAFRAVPLVLGWMRPKSVIDVGCGVGTWLREFQKAGVAEVLGIDGAHVTSEMLVIRPELFRAVDLGVRIAMARRFDLAVSLEVAEHLPLARAGTFVEDLCALAPVVLFSAAIPGQGGTHHVNEQWQSYWADQFGRLGYRPLDLMRGPLWDDPNVEFWYAQNMMVYAGAGALEGVRGSDAPLDLVHPRMFTAACERPSLAGRLARQLRRFGKT